MPPTYDNVNEGSIIIAIGYSRPTKLGPGSFWDDGNWYLSPMYHLCEYDEMLENASSAEESVRIARDMADRTARFWDEPRPIAMDLDSQPEAMSLNSDPQPGIPSSDSDLSNSSSDGTGSESPDQVALPQLSCSV